MVDWPPSSTGYHVYILGLHRSILTQPQHPPCSASDLFSLGESHEASMCPSAPVSYRLLCVSHNSAIGIKLPMVTLDILSVLQSAHGAPVYGEIG
jgi:hypothetical protein